MAKQRVSRLLHEPTSKLVAVSIKSLPTEFAAGLGLCTPYKLIVKSFIKDAEFVFETAPMPRPYSDAYEALRKHGFTVVALPDDWFRYIADEDTWKTSIIRDALRHVLEVNQQKESLVPSPTYKELARTVLLALNDVYPKYMSNLELKSIMKPEPSDEELLNVLDGLHHSGLIDGKGLYESMSGQHKLVVMAGIRISPKGMEEISEKDVPPHQVVQQFNMGPHSTGTIMGSHSTSTTNIHQQWAKVSNNIDLAKLITELQAVRTELMKTAKAPADFQQLQLVSEAEQYAEKHDGAKAMEVLSKAGKGLFDFAKDVGADITASLIAQAIGLKP